MDYDFRLGFECPGYYSLPVLLIKQEAVYDLFAINDSEAPVENLKLTISSEPAFFQTKVIDLGTLNPHTKRIFPDLCLDYDRTYLSYLAENTTSKITAELSQNGKTVASFSLNCDLIRYCCWGGVHFAPELLATLITPQQPQIQDLRRELKTILRKKRVTLASDGYQDHLDAESVRKDATSLMNAVFELVRGAGIIYSIQPPELTRRGAAISMPEETLAKKSGNALDAAILFCSCAECFGLNPVLLLSGEFVLVGAFLEPCSFACPVMDDLGSVLEAVGAKKLLLIDSTSMANGTSFGFAAACKMGEKRIRECEEFYFALDLFACRAQGIRPLENRVVYEDGIHFEKPGLNEEDDDVFQNDTAIAEASPDPFDQHIKEMRRDLCDLSVYHKLISLSEEDRVRILMMDPVRFLAQLGSGDPLPLFGPDAAFGYRGSAELSAKTLDLFEKRASAFPTTEGRVCLCFGLIKWKLKEAQGEAPLLIVPVSVRRERGRIASMTADVTPGLLNGALLNFLNEYFATDLSVLKEIAFAEFSDHVKQILMRARALLYENSALTFLDNEVFFALLQTGSLETLDALSVARLEGHPLSRAICADEAIEENASEPLPSLADAAPAVLSLPYFLDRDAYDVCASLQTRNFTLVSAPPRGGKTRLGMAQAFATLNHPEQTVLYVTGENGNPADAFHALRRAGLDDLAISLSQSSPSPADFSMKASDLFPTEDFFTKCALYADALKKLSGYEPVLNHTLPCGFTLEEAIFVFDHVRKAPDCLHFAPETVGNMSKETASAHGSVIRDLANALSSISTPVGHPLRFVGTRSFSYEIKAEATRLIDEYMKKSKEYLTFLRGSCAGLFAKAKPKNAKEEAAFLELLRLIGEKRGINECYFEKPVIASDLAKASTVLAYGKELCGMREEILQTFQPAAFDLPVKDMIVSWREAEHKKGGAKRKVQKEIIKKLVSVSRVKLEGPVPDLLYQLEKYINYQSYLEENASLLQRLFGVDVSAPQNDTGETWDRLNELFVDCGEFDRYLEQLGDDHASLRLLAAKLMHSFTAEDASRAASLREAILEMQAELYQVRQRFIHYVKLDFDALCRDHEEDLYEILPKLQKELREGLDGLQQWVDWLIASDEARAQGFSQILEEIAAGHLHGDDLEDAYTRAFFSALCEYVFVVNPILGELSGHSYTEKLDSLAALREEIYDLAKKELCAKHLRRYTSFLEESGWDPSQKFDLTRLNFARFCYQTSCRYPILVANAKDAIAYLNNTPTRFGLIVLDDAHTLSLSSALALIPRAQKVLILGTPRCALHNRVFDPVRISATHRLREGGGMFWEHAVASIRPMQLSRVRATNAALYELLDLCAKQAYPAIPFIRREDSIRCVKTTGLYDVATGINLQEGMQTVEEALRLMRECAESGRALSLGICAATGAQKLLILQTMAKKLREEPALYEVLRSASEPFYVISPDETVPAGRDVILWSLTVGANKATERPTRALAPINDPDAQSKVLAILTAARKELCLIHSINLDLLRDFALSTPGARAFERVVRAILERDSGACAVVDHASESDNPILARVAVDLESRGYSVSKLVSCGDFAIDLVARKPEDGDFALALLFDDTITASCKGHVLGETGLFDAIRARGYVPFHLRSADWFVDDQGVLDAIYALLPKKSKNSKK